MAFLLGGANSVSGYEVSNSLRFDNPTDDNLAITFGSAGNRRTFTISAWVKRSQMSDDHALIGQGGTGSNPRGLIFFDNSFRFTNNTSGSSTDTDVNTNALFRDPSAWYHAVAAVDTTQSTAANRVKLYVNGVHQTSLATATYPDEDFEMNWNNDVLHTVGRYPANDGYHMDGYISEFYFIDGTQYAASDFGETNDDGIWIPKNAKGDLTFGDNGFYLEFKQTGTDTDASGMGADTSGEDNHLAVNNLTAVDVTTDTPTNNFCTGNPIAKKNGTFDNVTYSEGNLKLTSPSVASNYTALGTFATKNMPFYYEIKLTDVNENNDTRVGVVNAETSGGSTIAEILYRGDGSVVSTGETALTSQGNLSDGTILSVACDPDTNVKFYLNGSLTSTIAINSSYQDLEYTFLYRIINTGNSEVNFGNPSYAISSGNSDANGYGNFEYAVPSGYYALCTKNLAEYG